MAMPKTALEGIRVLDLGRYTRPGRVLVSSWRVWGLRSLGSRRPVAMRVVGGGHLCAARAPTGCSTTVARRV